MIAVVALVWLVFRKHRFVVDIFQDVTQPNHLFHIISNEIQLYGQIVNLIKAKHIVLLPPSSLSDS